MGGQNSVQQRQTLLEHTTNIINEHTNTISNTTAQQSAVGQC